MTDNSTPAAPGLMPSDGMQIRSVGTVDESSFGFTGIGVGVSKLPGSAAPSPAGGQIVPTLQAALQSDDPHIRQAAQDAIAQRQQRAGADGQQGGEAQQ